jgi:hypothetical protein
LKLFIRIKKGKKDKFSLINLGFLSEKMDSTIHLV